MSKLKKILLTGAVLGSAASLAGLGTFATFTDTDSASAAIDTGTVVFNLGTPGAANRLNVDSLNMVPGDTFQRHVTFVNSGDQDLVSLKLTTTSSTSNVLTTDATNGLQMHFEACAGATGWTESTAPYTYTCDDVVAGDGLGVKSDVLASRQIIGSNLVLTTTALGHGVTQDVRLTGTLPVSADNTFQNLGSTITYTFNATQRNAVSK
jgi:spore coat-associated protein N